MLKVTDVKYSSGRALPQHEITLSSDQIQEDIAGIVKPKRKDTPTNTGTVELGKGVVLSYNIRDNHIGLFVADDKKGKKRLKKFLRALGDNVKYGDYKEAVEAIYQ